MPYVLEKPEEKFFPFFTDRELVEDPVITGNPVIFPVGWDGNPDLSLEDCAFVEDQLKD